MSFFGFKGFTEDLQFKEITTNEKGEANILFYTSDETGKFLITIERFSDEGIFGSKQLVLNVE